MAHSLPRRPVHGALLSAGLGTRLRPLSLLRPKPLVPLGADRLIDWGLRALGALQPERIGANVFHLNGAWPTELRAAGQPVALVREPQLQGTGGGLRGIAAQLGTLQRSPGATLVAINGDILFDFDLGPLLEAHRRSGALGTLVLRRVPPGSPFARVCVDARGRILRIAEIEAPSGGEPPCEPRQLAAYTGVQFLEAPLLAALPPEGACDILRSAWRHGLSLGWPLRAIFAPDATHWADVGTIDAYLEAHRALTCGQLAQPGLPPADAFGNRVDPTAQVAGRIVAPSIVLAHARIDAGVTVGPHAFIGADARVGADVREGVVWPQTTLSQPLSGGVALPDGQLAHPAEAPR